MESVITEGKRLIGNGNLKKALTYLIPIFESNNKREVVKELLLIQHRYGDCERRYRSGTILGEQRSVEINKLSQSVISILDSYDDKYFVDNNFKPFLGTIVYSIVLVTALALLVGQFLNAEYNSFYTVFFIVVLIFLVISALLFVSKKFDQLYSLFTDLWLGIISFIVVIPLFIRWFGKQYIEATPSIALLLVGLILTMIFLVRKSLKRYDTFLGATGTPKIIGVLLCFAFLIIILDSRFLIEELYNLLQIPMSDGELFGASNMVSSFYSVVPTQIKHIVYPSFLALFFMFFILTNLRNKKLHEET